MARPGNGAGETRGSRWRSLDALVGLLWLRLAAGCLDKPGVAPYVSAHFGDGFQTGSMAAGRLTGFARLLLALLIIAVGGFAAWHLGVRRLLLGAPEAAPRGQSVK